MTCFWRGKERHGEEEKFKENFLCDVLFVSYKKEIMQHNCKNVKFLSFKKI